MNNLNLISKYLKNPNSIELLYYLNAKGNERYSIMKKRMSFDQTLFAYTIRHLVEAGLVQKEKSKWIEGHDLDYRLTPLGKDMVQIINKMSRMF